MPKNCKNEFLIKELSLEAKEKVFWVFSSFIFSGKLSLQTQTAKTIEDLSCFLFILT